MIALPAPRSWPVELSLTSDRRPPALGAAGSRVVFHRAAPAEIDLPDARLPSVEKRALTPVRKFSKALIVLSVLLNLVVALPALVLVTQHRRIRGTVHESISEKVAKPQIIFVGDSITADAWVWAWRIGHWKMDVWNWGMRGFTTEQILVLADGVVQQHPKFCVIMAGTNDRDKTVAGAAHSFESYQALLDRLIAGGVEPIIISTLYLEDDPHPEFVTALNGHLTDYAREHNLSYIDLNQYLCRNRSRLPEYSHDGTHLTEAGYDVWARELKAVLAGKE